MVEDVKTNKNYLLDWYKDEYSTSKHLMVINSICRGLEAKNVGEIGFGRSTFALEASEGIWCCERYDYKSLFDFSDKYHFIKDINEYYTTIPVLEFMFIDYLSSRDYDVDFCYKAIKKAVKHVRQNGIVAVHDTLEEKYNAKAAIEKVKQKYGNGIEAFTFPYCFGMTLIRRLFKSEHGAIEVKSRKKQDENAG